MLARIEIGKATLDGTDDVAFDGAASRDETAADGVGARGAMAHEGHPVQPQQRRPADLVSAGRLFYPLVPQGHEEGAGDHGKRVSLERILQQMLRHFRQAFSRFDYDVAGKAVRDDDIEGPFTD